MMPAPLHCVVGPLPADPAQDRLGALDAFRARRQPGRLVIRQEIPGDIARIAGERAATRRGLSRIGQPIHASPRILADLFSGIQVVDLRRPALSTVGGAGFAAEVGFLGHGRSPSTLGAGIGLGDRFDYTNLNRLSIGKPNESRTAYRPNTMISRCARDEQPAVDGIGRA